MQLSGFVFLLCIVLGCHASHLLELAKIAKNFPDQSLEDVLKVKEGLKTLKTQSQLKLVIGPPSNTMSGDDSFVEQVPRYDVDVPKTDIFEANMDMIEYLYQGDIMLSPEEIEHLTSTRSKRNTLNGELHSNVRWETNRPIAFTISNHIGGKTANLIRKALKIWENNTCLTFKENGDSTGSTALQFISGGGCSSFVGKQYKRPSQTISIRNSCGYLATILHEIGHALGMHHTQSRVDRDNFVYVDQNAVYRNLWFNYKKEPADNNFNYGVRYDYGSIMHYGPNSFAIYSSKPTMIAKMSLHYHKTMGQRVFLAFSDIWVINKHHKCTEKCDRYHTPCQNGGYSNPRDCHSCKCPDGFSGQYCTERSPGDDLHNCGRTVWATRSWKNLKGKIGKDVWEEIPEMRCFFHINAPKGQRIEIRLNSIPSKVCTDNCQYGHTEFKVTDPRYYGYRFCCPEDAHGKTFKSDRNQVVIVLRSAFHYQMFDIDYRLAKNN